ncbi:hypothetical protein J4233_00985 [Candidatus Pacearchaeota archaeon]|nr:hypothetical protein [uncultured archaeon]AQS28850.1 hypothetical protein [uncultured archaeon]AQS29037.1 hypothetical protein [uncultured archaeon]MBS3076825.1 hypothetical protein [Candidatus Pacearchaeota archaeon]
MFQKKKLLEELADYFKNNLKKGYTKESLRWALVNQGYSRMEIEKAIRKAELDLAASAPILKTKPEIKYEIVTEDKPEKKRRWFGLFS